jgi:hypothetical protein
MDVFEQLILIMIIRREIINFGIKTKHYELLGIVNEKIYSEFYFLENHFKIKPESQSEDSPRPIGTKTSDTNHSSPF